jgi:hypothetical protein
MPSIPNPEKDALIQEVFNIAVMGGLAPDVERHFKETNRPITKAQLNELIQAKDALIKRAAGALGEGQKEKLIQQHLVLGRALFARSFACSDYKTCHSILQSERELLGLNKPKETKITGQLLTLNISEVVVTDREELTHDGQHRIESCQASPEAKAIR